VPSLFVWGREKAPPTAAQAGPVQILPHNAVHLELPWVVDCDGANAATAGWFLALGRDQFAEAAFGPANRSSRFNKLWAWALPQYL